MEITNYQLQRYVNSIINHEGVLYYVSKNKLFSFDIGSFSPSLIICIGILGEYYKSMGLESKEGGGRRASIFCVNISRNGERAISQKTPIF